MSHATRTDSTPVAEPVKLRGMPKATDPELLARAAVLLATGMSARAVARQVCAEFPGRSISHTRVAELAPALNIELQPGRPVGIPHPQEPTSPHRHIVRDLHAQGLTLGEIAEQVPLSRERIRQLISDGK